MQEVDPEDEEEDLQPLPQGREVEGPGGQSRPGEEARGHQARSQRKAPATTVTLQHLL